MLNKKKILIIIPAWNEYKNLVEIRPKSEDILRILKESYELEYIVIDNHNSDDASTLMRSYCNDSAQWKYVKPFLYFLYELIILK
jgi:hypothetical protein